MKYIVCIALPILFASASWSSPTYQQQIEKSYRGFQVLTKKEFNSKFIKSEEPGLVFGDFNGDKIPDFAAMIRAKKKKRYEAGTNSYNYYDGKVVACHGNKDKSYKCQKISEALVVIPQQSYLSLAKPKKTGCYRDDGSKDYLNVKNDAIGWYYPEKGGSHFIFQKDGSYKNCVTSD